MDTSHQDNVRELYELIRGIKFAMLTTVDAQGRLRSRPMATLEAEPDGHLWFFTAVDAPKVEETRRDHHVNLAFAEPGKDRYVSVSGQAELVRDRARIRALWQPTHKAFFPGGLDDPQLALLRVTPDAAEFWSGAGGFIGKTLRMAKAFVTGEPEDLGEHQKLKL